MRLPCLSLMRPAMMFASFIGFGPRMVTSRQVFGFGVPGNHTCWMSSSAARLETKAWCPVIVVSFTPPFEELSHHSDAALA